MKTNTKIEIGILAFAAILSLIFQVHVKSASNSVPDIKLTGQLIEKTLEITQFSELEIQLSIHTEYLEGEPRIVISTDKAFIDNIEIEQKGESLHIYENSNIRGNQNSLRTSTVKIYNNKALSLIRSTSNSRITFEQIQVNDKLRLQVQGNGSIDGKNISTQAVYFDGDGNGSIHLTGDANFLEVSTNGNSHYNFSDFDVKELTLYSNGNSGGKAKVSETVDARANGNSQVSLFGDPQKTRINSNGNANISIQD